MMTKEYQTWSGGQSALSRIFSLNYLPAFVAIVAMVGIIVYADWHHQQSAREDLRNNVAEHLGLVRTKLEGSINGNVSLVRGLVGVIEAEPDMNQERFAALASRVFANSSQFISIAVAPDLVVSMVYPYEANRKVIGLDYMRNDNQRPTALLARDTRQTVVTGPVKLVQGGDGLIARFPVVTVSPSGEEKFWGIVSAVMDLGALYRHSGLLGLTETMKVSLRSLDHTRADEPPFFGDVATESQDPVQMLLRVGHEDWLVSAVPKDGWEMPFADVWRFRLALLLGEFVIVLPMIWAGRLMEERQRNVRIIEQRDDQMKALSHRLQIALETSKIGIWEYDITTNRLIWDARMRDIYAVPENYAVSTYDDWRKAIHPDDIEHAEQEFERSVRNEGGYACDFRVIGREGDVRYIRAIGTCYRDSRGHRKMVGVNWDVTNDIRLQEDLRQAKMKADEQNRELERARLKMETAALHDPLTELPNRRYLDRVIAGLEQDSDAFKPLTILHIDLDRFKDINDTLGHAAGDLILRHAANTLRANVEEGDFLARIGGDEFVILSQAGHSEEHVADYAARLVEAISKPVDYHGHECRVGASIGIATRTDGERIDQTLINADIALYEAKRRGRNRVERFSDTLRQVAINTKKTADEILRGLEQNEFIAYFQPQFCARTLEIVGIEALARWDHPTKGILGPDAFLKIAENLKVVAAIDDAILNQALLQFYRLEANGIPVPKVSVNISAQRLRDDTLLNRLREISFRPGTLSFELLESISLDGHDGELLPEIESIRALGIDIDIDDFGTGYASIVTLLKLTPKRLKIDRQLIAPITESAAQQQLVRSIIDIGRARGIEVVAEGVETTRHIEILRDMGCDALQGYALSRPLPPSELVDFIKSRRWLQAMPERLAV